MTRPMPAEADTGRCVGTPGQGTPTHRHADVDHPVPGARAGEVIAVGPRHRWIAYGIDGYVVAASYLDGRLVRRDLTGWWTAGPRGERCPVTDADVAALVGCVPDGWPVLAEHAPLLGTEALGVAS